MESKRVLLAVILTFVILSAWSAIFAPRPPEPAPTPTEGVESASPSPVAESTGHGASPGQSPAAEVERGAPGETAPAAEEIASAATEPVGEAIAAESERRFHVRSRLYDVTLTNRGASVESWLLPGYDEHVTLPTEPPSESVDVVSRRDVPLLAPLSVVTGDVETDEAIGSALFFAGTAEDVVLKDGEEATVRFEWADGRGRRVEKELRFRGDSYVVDVSVRVAGPKGERSWLALGPGFATHTDPERGDAYAGRFTVVAGPKPNRENPATIEPEAVRAALGGAAWPPQSGDWLAPLRGTEWHRSYSGGQWVALEDNYFAGVLFTQGPLPDVEAVVVPERAQGQRAWWAPLVALGGDGLEAQLYVGPKDAEILRAVRADLPGLIHFEFYFDPFGLFSGLSKGLLWALKFLHQYVKNYGIAIVLLTLVIKVLFLPLNFKQLESMQKMSKLRPQLKQIEEKYKRITADPKVDREKRLDASRRKNQEVMELYKREGFNPASGCLPILLYMPFMYGFYSILSVAIELRHAPFVWPFVWINDLSAKDPTFVLPILMVISMIVQQALTPMAGDPMQRRMMYVMPVFFGFLFKDLASGLVLFWLTQNALSIVQQNWMNKLTKRREEEEKAARDEERRTRRHDRRQGEKPAEET